MQWSWERKVVVIAAGLLGGTATWASDTGIGIAFGDPTNAYLECKAVHSLFACDAYARLSDALIFEKPDAKARVLERHGYGQTIRLLEPARIADKAEWIRTRVIRVYVEKGEEKAKQYFGYVRRADVILDTDFRRVTGCWPVKYLKDPEGGYDYYPGAVYFTMQGVGSYPHHPVSVVEYGEQHTYYADGVFSVRHEKYNDRHLYGHGVLDYAKRTVLHAGTTPLKEGEQLQWFSPEEMKDCKQVPTVDPDSRAPNPKALKRH